VVAVDERGFQIEEVVCSPLDNACVAVNVPVAWPQSACTLSGCFTTEEMTAAFEQLARAAMPGPPLDEPAGGLPDDRELQLLLGLQDLLNARFETHLRRIALKFASDVVSATETLQRAQIARIGYEGMDLALEVAETQLNTARRVDLSIRFDPRCASEAQVEDRVMALALETSD
jgi:hypothetical protein